MFPLLEEGTHLLLHCLAVLSLNCAAIMVQLPKGKKDPVINKSLKQSNEKARFESAENTEYILISAMKRDLSTKHAILLRGER